MVAAALLALAGAAATPGAFALPTDEDVARLSGGLDAVWVLAAGCLVFLMQAGFALLGAGALRAKNTLNYLAKSYLDFCLGAFAFLLVGYALMFGGSGLAPGLDRGNAFVGFSGWALGGNAYTSDGALFWFFQMMFAATAATIVAGAVAERMKLGAYVAYSVLVTALIYPLHGHWIWGGGWLAQRGAVDFAGSGAVHAVGGFVALAGAAAVGPRLGKFVNGRPRRLPGHNVTFVVLGAFLLFFGWFGFNAGSTLSGSDPRIAVIAVNTFLAGAAGAVAVFLWTAWRGQPDVALLCNGSLAGLVGVTAGCAFVAPWAALVIGLVAGLLLLAGLWFVESVLRVDDPIGAVACHGVNGVWGLLAVGVFADGTYGGVAGLVAGNTALLGAQALAAATVTGWSLGAGFLMFWALRATLGLRVRRDHELVGLDLNHHGARAYPEWAPLGDGAAGGVPAAAQRDGGEPESP